MTKTSERTKDVSTEKEPGRRGNALARVLPVERLTNWLRRWARRFGRLVVVIAAAGLANLIGLPAIAAVLLSVGLGALITFRGPLASPGVDSLVRSPRLGVLIAVMLALSATSWSYTGYLTDPGAATFAVRTADWMRDHGLSPVVDQIELRLYGKDEPGNQPVNLDQLPRIATGTPGFPVQSPLPVTGHAPAAITVLLDPSLAGEGLWTPNARQVNGDPVTYTTFFRPDAAHLNVVSAAVWMDPETTTLVYSPGTKEPEGSNWAWNSGIPRAERDTLVAAFNAGFKFKDIDGGMFTEGRTPYPLIDGQASLVIYRDGRVDIGTWGEDVTMDPEVLSVRQNLQMIVEDGVGNPGLASSIQAEWGKRLWQLQYTRRSGIGVTADGALVYVAGSRLTTETLGNALVRAGTVTAMELDIHSKQPTFNFFEPSPSNRALVTGTKLLPDMQRAPNRYLEPDQRDFFALVLR